MNAPRAWGHWPPSQEIVNAVLTRAARKLATQIEGKPWASGIILVAEPVASSQLDCSFTGRETEICIGHIRGYGKHRAWQVFWNPAQDTGRLASMGHYDWRS